MLDKGINKEPAEAPRKDAAFQQLEAASRFNEDIVNTLHEPLVVLNGDYRVVAANAAFYQTFYTSALLTIGFPFFDLGTRQWDQPSLRMALDGLASRNKAFLDLEVRGDFPGIGFRVMWLNGQKFTQKHDEQAMILLAMEDVTERIRTEQEMQYGDAFRRSILDSVPDALIVTDEAGIIQSFSKSAEQLFGYTATEVIGRNINIIMSSPDREKHDEYIASYLKTGVKRALGSRREVSHLRKDGTTFPGEINLGEINVQGKRFFTGFIHDTTNRHLLESELHHAQKMEAVGQLTGGVAHDFNNLLTVILGNLEMLESLEGNDKPKRNLIRNAKKAVSKGSQLIDRLLAFARRQPMKSSIVDLNHLVSSFIDMTHRTLGSNIKISVELHDALWPVSVDKGQLESAILNLVINARDAMPHGGTLTIKTRNLVLDARAAAKYPEVKPGDYVELSVHDTGEGMTREVAARAFEPFFTTKEAGAGTGLGLSMVYGFAKQSRGHAQIDSKPGHGATITLYLPKAEKPLPKSSARKAKTGDIPWSRGETILVVEDDEQVRQVAVGQLKGLGYKVIEAKSGKAAYDLLLNGLKLDLIFTDIVMPGGMSGLDLARNAHQRNPGLKILCASGFAAPALDKNSEEMDYPAFLKKPYSASELAGKIRQVLDS